MHAAPTRTKLPRTSCILFRMWNLCNFIPDARGFPFQRGKYLINGVKRQSCVCCFTVAMNRSWVSRILTTIHAVLRRDFEEWEKKPRSCEFGASDSNWKFSSAAAEVWNRTGIRYKTHMSLNSQYRRIQRGPVVFTCRCRKKEILFRWPVAAAHIPRSEL